MKPLRLQEFLERAANARKGEDSNRHKGEAQYEEIAESWENLAAHHTKDGLDTPPKT